MSTPLSQARSLIAAGDLDAAEALCDEFLAQQPDARDMLICFAQIAGMRREWQTAIARWQRVLDLEPENRQAWLAQAADLIERGCYEEAEALLIPAQEKWPAIIAPFHLLSRAIERRRRLRTN